MASEIKVSNPVVSCSDNGQHPLVYINLKGGKGRCQYCGQVFIYVAHNDDKGNREAA